MDWGVLLLNLGLNLFVTMFAYLLIPAILAFRGKPYTAKGIKRISIINCVVVWVLFRILEISLENDPSSGAAVILWGAVGYSILKKNCLKEGQTDNTPVSETQPAQTPSKSVKSKTKFCSRCGKPIHPTTKKCTGCGKQYFGGSNLKKLLAGVLCIFLIASLTGNIVLYYTNKDLYKTIDDLSATNKSLRDSIYDTKTELTNLSAEIESLELELYFTTGKLDSLRGHIVFIPEEDSRFYHQHDCPLLQNSDSLNIHHINDIMSQVYALPCPKCN